MANMPKRTHKLRNSYRYSVCLYVPILHSTGVKLYFNPFYIGEFLKWVITEFGLKDIHCIFSFHSCYVSDTSSQYCRLLIVRENIYEIIKSRRMWKYYTKISGSDGAFCEQNVTFYVAAVIKIYNRGFHRCRII